MNNKPKFHGQGVLWFTGVVEENNDMFAKDGLMIGRCQVRILGIHSAEKIENDETGEGIPVEKLVWALPVMPPIYSSMGHIGASPANRIMKGSWVLLMAMDGTKAQEIFIMGTLKGRPIERLNPENQVFCDPDYFYPTDGMLNLPDTHPLAMGGTGGDIVKQKNEERNVENDTASFTGAGAKWSQPLSPYGAHYPNNLVYGSEFGHVKEVDDTIGARRLHWWHSSHTFIEIDETGTKVCKTVGDDYEITVKDRNVLVKGNCNITVEGDATMLVKGDSVTQVKGDAELLIEGDADTHVKGDADTDIDGDFDENVDGDKELTVDGDYDIKSKSNIKIKARNIGLSANSRINIDAPNIDLWGVVRINGIIQIGH